MADLTTEEIAELRRLHAEAVECRKQFEGRITARMAGVFVSRLPALLDMAERCAKAEAERNELALHVLRFSTKALKEEA